MSAISRAVGRFFGFFASVCMTSSRSSLLRFARSGFGDSLMILLHAARAKRARALLGGWDARMC